MKTKTAYLILALCLVAIVFAIPVYADFVPQPITVDKALNAESNPSNFTANSTTISSCRHGVSAFGEQTAFLETVGFGHYQNFSARPDVVTSNVDFLHHVAVTQHKTATGEYLSTYSLSPDLTPSRLGVLVEDNPGAVWIVGNEPDRGPNPGEIDGGQDDTFPEIYAQAYHDTYHFIKDIDPTAQVAIAGLVQVTPGRLQYLDIVWDSYLDRYGSPMPVDIWTMHVYVLPELNSSGSINNIATIALGTDPSLGIRQAANASECHLDDIYCLAEHVDIDAFAQQVVAMRQWMKAHGQQYKPLILTEFSSLLYSIPTATNILRDEYGELFTRERIQVFMDETINYLSTAADPDLGYPYDQDKLVQQWLWFSMYSRVIGSGSNLLNNDQDALRTMGQNFQQIIASQPYKPNLMVGRTYAQVGPIAGGKADVQLSAEIFNNGSQAVSEAMTVHFYRDSALTQPIGDPVQLSADLSGCARLNLTASLTWANRSPGVHHYWVKVETVSNETNSSDNVGEGSFIIDPNPILIPIAYR